MKPQLIFHLFTLQLLNFAKSWRTRSFSFLSAPFIWKESISYFSIKSIWVTTRWSKLQTCRYVCSDLMGVCCRFPHIHKTKESWQYTRVGTPYIEYQILNRLINSYFNVPYKKLLTTNSQPCVTLPCFICLGRQRILRRSKKSYLLLSTTEVGTK